MVFAVHFMVFASTGLPAVVCVNKSKIAQAECKDESLLSGFAEAPPIFERSSKSTVNQVLTMQNYSDYKKEKPYIGGIIGPI